MAIRICFSALHALWQSPLSLPRQRLRKATAIPKYTMRLSSSILSDRSLRGRELRKSLCFCSTLLLKEFGPGCPAPCQVSSAARPMALCPSLGHVQVGKAPNACIAVFASRGDESWFGRKADVQERPGGTTERRNFLF